MDGVGDGQFASNATTTRAQLVTILYRSAGEPAVAGDVGFTDVADGLWYTDAVLWAAQKGIVNGISETEFAPSGDLTREQLATILIAMRRVWATTCRPLRTCPASPTRGTSSPTPRKPSPGRWPRRGPDGSLPGPFQNSP